MKIEFGACSNGKLSDSSNDCKHAILITPREHQCSLHDESTWKEQELLKTLDLKDKEITNYERILESLKKSVETNSNKVSELCKENAKLFEKIEKKNAAIDELIGYIIESRENITLEINYEDDNDEDCD